MHREAEEETAAGVGGNKSEWNEVEPTVAKTEGG